MKKKQHIVTVLILVFLVSCTSNTIYKKPKNLIPKEQMVDLLTDMFIARAAHNIENKNGERKINYMPLVYEKYKIDSLRFSVSNQYYMSRVDEYEIIYKEVEIRLKEKHKIADSEKKLQDSLTKLNNKTLLKGKELK